jgi:hypothetical protein
MPAFLNLVSRGQKRKSADFNSGTPNKKRNEGDLMAGGSIGGAHEQYWIVQWYCQFHLVFSNHQFTIFTGDLRNIRSIRRGTAMGFWPSMDLCANFLVTTANCALMIHMATLS